MSDSGRSAQKLTGDEHEPNDISSPTQASTLPIVDTELEKVVRVPSLDSRYTPPVLEAMSMIDIVLVVMSHAKDAFGWDNVFLCKTFDYGNDDSNRAWQLAKSLLDLGLVNKLWRRAFLLRILPSTWAVIPASLSGNSAAIRTCMCLSRSLPLTITLRLVVRLDSSSRRRNDQDFSVFETAASRITTIRTSIMSPSHFYELIRRRTLVGQWRFISSATTLEVHARAISTKSPLWLRIPPPHLTTLRLTNFTFTRLCALPATLTSLALNFTPPPPPRDWNESSLGRPMGLDDLTGILSRLPLLEVLNVDLRFMAQALMSQVELPGLKQLIVRACVPNIFNAFLSHISCPPLDRAYTIMELTENSVVEVARDLKAASIKLAQLTLRGSNPSSRQPDKIDFGHVYLDDRGTNGWGALCQNTIAIAARSDSIPFVNDTVPTDRLASTAAFVFTVTRPVQDRRLNNRTSDRDASSVLGPIVEGLPRMDIESLTVHFRPGGENRNT